MINLNFTQPNKEVLNSLKKDLKSKSLQCADVQKAVDELCDIIKNEKSEIVQLEYKLEFDDNGYLLRRKSLITKSLINKKIKALNFKIKIYKKLTNKLMEIHKNEILEGKKFI